MRGLALILGLLATQSAAQVLPAVYRVTDVAADDVLNVRVAPNAAAEVLGGFANGTVVEVVAHSENGRWAQVNVGEQSGWVALRYLDVVSDSTWPPHALSCFGTEPFWSATLVSARDGYAVTFDRQGAASLRFRSQALQSSNRTDRFSAAGHSDAGQTVVSVIRREACGDGMSDQSYGLSTEIVVIDGAPLHYSGFCSLAP